MFLSYAHQKYSKNSNIMKYYKNLKEPFSILICFKVKCISPLLQSKVTLS